MFKFSCTSIRNQMFFLILLMTCLPLGIIIYSAVKQYHQEVNAASATVTSVTGEISNDHNALLDGAEQMVAALSSLPAVHHHNSAAVDALLAEFVKISPSYIDIVMLDASGLLWASAAPSPKGMSFADRTYFKNAVTSGKVSSGGYADAKNWQVPVITLGYPVKNRSGLITDVCVVVISLDIYTRLYTDKYPNPVSSILFTDRDGTILYSSVNSQLIGKQDRENLFKQMARGPVSGSFEGTGNLGTRRIFAYQQIQLKGASSPYLYIRSGLNKEHVLHNVYNDLIVNIGTLLAIMIFVLATAIYISKKGILDKVAALRDSTQKITRGDLEAICLNPASTNELDQLECSLSSMAQQLSSTEEALRQSVSNYRGLVDNVSSIILKWDTEGNILFINC